MWGNPAHQQAGRWSPLAVSNLCVRREAIWAGPSIRPSPNLQYLTLVPKAGTSLAHVCLITSLGADLLGLSHHVGQAGCPGHCNPTLSQFLPLSIAALSFLCGIIAKKFRCEFLSTISLTHYSRILVQGKQPATPWGK